jgi:hypothetical protein
VLPWFLEHLARVPELLVLFAIAWAVGLAAFGDWLGFSKEVGAFAAGMSIASTPYRDAIGSRLISLRDFLLLFFFIHLGSGLNLSLLGAEVLPALVFSVFVLVGNPLIVMVIMGRMGYRKRTGFLAGLTVAQISEFSLILIGLGATLGHVDEATVGLVTLVGLITIGLSTYMILYSGNLYRWLAPWLKIFERRVPFREETPAEQDAMALPQVDVLMFGLGNYGGSIVRGLLRRGQQVVGVDFDPQILRYWREQNVLVLYGDMEDPDLLEHLPIRRTRWVLTAAPDRESTTALVKLLRAAGYPGKLALTARTHLDAEHYETLGADLVLRPYADAAEQAVDALNAAMHLCRRRASGRIRCWRCGWSRARCGRARRWARSRCARRPASRSSRSAGPARRPSIPPRISWSIPETAWCCWARARDLARGAAFITRREFGSQDPDSSYTVASVDVPRRAASAARPWESWTSVAASASRWSGSSAGANRSAR